MKVYRFVFGVVLPIAAWAQNSGIQGVITDPSGATVPEAAVTVTNVFTGVVYTARTNARGLYSPPSLPPSPYKVEAAKTGFATVTRENLKLDGDQTSRVDFTLRLGA